MATVLLLRHGRSTANTRGVLAGDLPIVLDEHGRAQAVAVARRLRHVPLAAVVSSPAHRCRQTAHAVLAEHAPHRGGHATAQGSSGGASPYGLVDERGLSIDDRLAEAGYGDWTGRHLDELAQEPLWQVVQHRPSAAVFPGGESLAVMAARGVAAVRDWDAKLTRDHGPHAVWVACSHADVIKAVVADAVGLHFDQFQRIVVDPASLTVIRYTDTRPFLVRLNDVGGDRRGPRPMTESQAATSDVAAGSGAGRVTT